MELVAAPSVLAEGVVNPEAALVTVRTETPSRAVLAVKDEPIAELASAGLEKLPPEMELATIKEPAPR